MVYFKIGIQDFISEDKFRNLQEKFMLLDFNAEYDYKLKHIEKSEKLSIKISEADINGENFQLIDFRFLEDFLYLEIPKLGEYHLSQFIKKLNKQYSPSLKNGLASKLTNDIREAKRLLTIADYLTDVIKRHLLIQLEYVEDGLESYINNPYPKINHKLQFNLQRNDLLMLFHLFRENKVINSIADRDLGKILDNFSEYREKASGTYQEVKYSRKELNNYRNLSKSDKKPLQRLQELFLSKDFFYLKP